MIGVAMYITIKSLWERHKNKSLIARLTGHDWKTVAQKIKEIEAGKEYPKKKPHPRILDSHQEQKLKWLEEDLSKVRIHVKIQQKGVKMGYSTVKEYLVELPPLCWITRWNFKMKFFISLSADKDFYICTLLIFIKSQRSASCSTKSPSFNSK